MEISTFSVPLHKSTKGNINKPVLYFLRRDKGITTSLHPVWHAGGAADLGAVADSQRGPGSPLQQHCGPFSSAASQHTAEASGLGGQCWLGRAAAAVGQGMGSPRSAPAAPHMQVQHHSSLLCIQTFNSSLIRVDLTRSTALPFDIQCYQGAVE